MQNTLKVVSVSQKVHMSYKDGGWQLPNAVDVTDQHTITVSEDGRSFRSESWGYY